MPQSVRVYVRSLSDGHDEVPDIGSTDDEKGATLKAQQEKKAILEPGR